MRVASQLKRLKKLFSILFLMIFLFNIGGYYVVFWHLRSNARQNLLHRLDAEKYSDDELIVLTVPLALPYPIQQNGYERVDGDFEFGGEYYSLVKQRLENDTLFMLCIKDHQQKRLINEMNAFSDLANSLPTSAKHTLDLFGKLFKDYSVVTMCITNHPGWSMQITFVEPTFTLTGQCYPVISPPPDLTA